MADEAQTTKERFDAMGIELEGLETVGEGAFKLLGTVVDELLGTVVDELNALRNQAGGPSVEDIDNVTAEIDARKAAWAAQLAANTLADGEPQAVPPPAPVSAEPAQVIEPGTAGAPAASSAGVVTDSPLT